MLRVPYRTLYTKNVTSTLNGVDTFTLPFSDFDSLHCKLIVTSIGSGATNQLNVWIQSTDDGGTNYYDNVAFGTVSGAVTTANALSYDIPVAVGSTIYVANITASSTSNYVGATGGSGLPLLTNQLRLVWAYGTMTATASTSWTMYISANNQAPGPS